jgi:hypothetical protein
MYIGFLLSPTGISFPVTSLGYTDTRSIDYRFDDIIQILYTAFFYLPDVSGITVPNICLLRANNILE